ncbi:MAG: response regulator transcription factor [Gemmatimonadota bacterium]
MTYPAVEFDALPSGTRDLHKENALLGEILRATVAMPNPVVGVQRAAEILRAFFGTASVGIWFVEGDQIELRALSLPESIPSEVSDSVVVAYARLPLHEDRPGTRAMRSGTVLQWRSNDPSIDRPTRDALAALGAGELYAFPIMLDEGSAGCGLVGLPEGRLLEESDQKIVTNVLEYLARMYGDTVSDAGRLSGQGEGGLTRLEGEARRRPRVLLVEGDALTAEVIQHRFERQGLDVHHCDTGEAAVADFADVEPDICLTELKLPDMEGFELLERLRARTRGREVPVIVLTSLASEKMIVRAFTLGADDYIVKPFSLTELTARVKRRLAVGTSMAPTG